MESRYGHTGLGRDPGRFRLEPASYASRQGAPAAGERTPCPCGGSSGTAAAVAPLAPFHVPVLVNETLASLKVQPDATLIDCTVGDAGHTIGFLQAAGPGSRALALDRDAEALHRARVRLQASGLGDRVVLVHSDFAALQDVADRHGFGSVDNVLMDLGFSSFQIDTAERGFSFRQAGPLDMRMNRAQGLTAADLVNGYSRQELADLIFVFGEEPQARRIAAAIVRNRPFADTAALAHTIAGARRQQRAARRHPATRTFQALRIAVNEELTQLQAALPQARELLAPDGHICVISFHSLEDRVVKSFLHRHSARPARTNKYAPPPPPARRAEAPLSLLYRRVVKPGIAEVEANARSRSARLRAARKQPMGA